MVLAEAWRSRIFGRIGVALALGAAAAAGCGDGENTANMAGSGGTSGSGAMGGSEAGAGVSGGASGDAGGVSRGGTGGQAGGGEAGRSHAGEAGEGGTTGGQGGASAGGTAAMAGDTNQGGAGQGTITFESAPSCDPPKGTLPKLKLTSFAKVDEPVQAVAPPADPRLFVVSRAGSIVVVKDGEVKSEPFLAMEVDHHYSELGLLGLAFHPDFATNGLFYVHHIAPRIDDQDTGDLLVEEYAVDPEDPDRALPTPRRELIRIPQPSQKHKAGTMTFDSQGLLYIAIGNGGETAASHDTTLLRGKVLRLLPDPERTTYAIPGTNPLLDGWEPEILDTGFRNPWRIALDPCTDDLYVGDVGNATAEEINVIRAGDHGRDFGFPAYEGTERTCDKCESNGTETMPLIEYNHDVGCAVIGGVVYRGHAIPALRGMYLYSDLCGGTFNAFRYDGSEAKDAVDLSLDLNPDAIDQISSFGTDAGGEVYVTSLHNRVYRIDPE
jgi:glucose/arabinose dehydrogenase